MKSLRAIVLLCLCTAACGEGLMNAQQNQAISISSEERTLAESAFIVCAGCHAAEYGQPSMIGPNLAGVYGREAGTLPGFQYSSAMQGAQIVWDDDSIDAYIKSPQGLVPGTSMAFSGLKDAKQRAAIVKWLRSKSK